uniref:Uncharacterized protein n=1 Tax=Hordeum vulgare subsp. vulgare TaxID=112509 RepID=A0A8I6Y2Z3_HORVV
MMKRGEVHRRARHELSITLLIDTKEAKVCFAEAGTKVVEVLCGLLSLPLCTVSNVLTQDRMAGSVGNLLASAERQDANYSGKEQHLSPAVSVGTLCRLEELLGAGLTNCNTRFYTCENTNTRRSCGFLSASSGVACPSCKGRMFDPMRVTSDNEAMAAGGTSRACTYTIKDDLSMTPAPSLLSGITMLAHCGVEDITVLERKTVKIGKEEALGILSAALKSKTVLTDVFLPKKNARY